MRFGHNAARRYLLFVPDFDAGKEQWDGATLSCRAAVESFGADEALPLSELEKALEKARERPGAPWGGDMCRPESQLPAPLQLGAVQGKVLVDQERSLGNGSRPLAKELRVVGSAVQEGRTRPLRPLLHQLRWVKSPTEVELMRQSARLAARSLRECMREAVPGRDRGTRRLGWRQRLTWHPCCWPRRGNGGAGGGPVRVPMQAGRGPAPGLSVRRGLWSGCLHHPLLKAGRNRRVGPGWGSCRTRAFLVCLGVCSFLGSMATGGFHNEGKPGEAPTSAHGPQERQAAPAGRPLADGCWVRAAWV